MASVGSTGDNQAGDVLAVQTTVNAFLASSGLPTIAEDGSAGPATFGAIASFLEAQGAPADAPIEVVAIEGDGGFGQDAVELAQGQGDGTSPKEAARLAREDCIKNAACDAGSVKVDKHATCWKGGDRGWVCTVQCSCPGEPIS